MKLTSIKRKLSDSTRDSILDRCFSETYFSISSDIWNKIFNEIWIPNEGSIEDTQRRILNNLQDEIN